MPFDRDTFASHLRRERERRGISLEDISARTKIARSFLAKLERGDLSDWPSGIFRRGFFRGYAAAVGLDADGLMEEFLKLFPDPASEPIAAPAASGIEPASAADLRLTMDDAASSGHAAWRNLRAAIVDTLGILSATAVVSFVTGHAAIVAALIAVLYHAATTAWGRGTLVPMRQGSPPERAGARPAPARARTPESSRRSGHRLRVVEPPVGRSSRAVS